MIAWLKAFFKRLLEQLIKTLPTEPPKPPEPQPEPEPEPQPEPQPEPSGPKDELDLSIVIFDGDPISPAKWPITASITQAAFMSDGVRAKHTGTEKWPVRPDGGEKPTIGNWVLIAKCSDGNFHGSSIEWFGSGKTVVTGKKWDGYDDIRGKLGTWRPVRGEAAWLLLCGVVRGAPFTVQERTQAVKILIV